MESVWRNISGRLEKGAAEMDKRHHLCRVSLLVNGRSHIGLLAAALASLGLAVGSGILVAKVVDRFYLWILESRSVETLAGGAVRYVPDLSCYTNGENIELLFQYIDSMAGAVSNLELSPKWRLEQFTVLLHAAEESGVNLVDFEREDGLILRVTCEGTEPDVERFAALVAEDEGFSNTEIDKSTKMDGGIYTIVCCFAR